MYQAAGKLLLFGEYLVLKGALALAIPLRFGQTMTVEKRTTPGIKFVSTVQGDKWFEATFSPEWNIEAEDREKATIIRKLLLKIREEKPGLFESGLHVSVNADFPLEWGFGTSSTLVSLLAQWSGTDAFSLLEHSFGGSGYDVAAATAQGPLIYGREGNQIEEVSISPEITGSLLFVYSGQKQKSAPEVARFNKIDIGNKTIALANKIVRKAVECKNIEAFEVLIHDSDDLLSEILDRKPLRELNFADYSGQIKWLGAWGGDFFMATFRDRRAAQAYFLEKGFRVQFFYDQIIKKRNG